MHMVRLLSKYMPIIGNVVFVVMEYTVYYVEDTKLNKTTFMPCLVHCIFGAFAPYQLFDGSLEPENTVI